MTEIESSDMPRVAELGVIWNLSELEASPVCCSNSCAVSSLLHSVLADCFVSVSGSRTWLLFEMAFPRR